jgi:ATP-dependent Clp protease ATP-binding subunit ClpA
MGARPLRRAVQRYLEDPLAEEILRGDLAGADKVEVIRGDGGLVFRTAVAAG